MALFNGEQYLEQQIQSILVQLSNEDEMIIVNDCSRDGSVDLLKNIGDPRITLLQNADNRGPAASFERALLSARGEYIFLADQDDIWKPDKVATIRRVFDTTNSIVVVSDARVVDSNRNVLFESLFSLRGSGRGFWRNLYKNGFVGCCMALRHDAKSFILPFPIGIGMHDEWIGLCSSLAGRVHFTAEKLIDYRRHEGNATQLEHGSLLSMLRKRIRFFWFVLERMPRILIWRLRRHSDSR
jgi:glycosyltransferase involved in cell wall biosynthesis